MNSICTTRGGSHVTYVTDQLVHKLQEALKKKTKAAKLFGLKPNHFKANMWIFINCLIENPTFDSQTKETLTLKKDMFGSTCSLTDRFSKQGKR